jgi:hypothetical protein
VLTASEGDALLRLGPALRGRGTAPAQTFAVLLKVLRDAPQPRPRREAEFGGEPRDEARAEFSALCLLRLVVLQVGGCERA